MRVGLGVMMVVIAVTVLVVVVVVVDDVVDSCWNCCGSATWPELCSRCVLVIGHILLDVVAVVVVVLGLWTYGIGHQHVGVVVQWPGTCE